MRSWRPSSISQRSMRALSLGCGATGFFILLCCYCLLSVSAVTLPGSSECPSLVNHPDLRHNHFSYRRTYRPTSYHIAQELQKYNIPDYRPRQEQYVIHTFLPSRPNTALRFQKAIKKVRAVQRLRRTRGFAFSQTETAGQQDQARLIRAYDTSKSHHRPSGL